MQTISLADSGVNLSRLVYGAWRLSDDSDTSKAHVERKLKTCLDLGISSFDHADIYGDYECEALFGQQLAADKSLRHKIQLISKCDIALMSNKYPDRRVKHYDTSAPYINNSVEQSLKNLHTDHLDLLLLHRPDPFMDAAETAAALDGLVDSGKVRAIGVSNFQSWDWRLLKKYLKHPLVVNQIEMSLLNSGSFSDGTMANMQLDDLQAMAWSPLAGGDLFSDNAAALRLKPMLQSMADSHNASADAVAIAWLLAHPANIIPVLGSNSITRIQQAAQAAQIKLSRVSWFELLTLAQGHEVP